MDGVFEFMEFLTPLPPSPSLSRNGWNFGFMYYSLGLFVRRTYNGRRVYLCGRMRYLHICLFCLLFFFPGVTTHCGCIFTAQ
jgi:hypothetical protein